MQFILSQIQKKAYNQSFTFDEEVDVTELESMNNDIRKAKPARVYGECYLEENEIFFSLNIIGEVILPCARTLADVPYSFHINKTEIFSTSPYYGEEEKEEDIHQVQGEVIDLTPLILENIVLELPYRVYSEDEEVLKEAVMEGEGWEFKTEEEPKEEKIDPRLKKLQQLLDNNEEDE